MLTRCGAWGHKILSLDLSSYAARARQRRERAADLWQSVPASFFDLRASDCASRMSPLGWLAARSLDGWHNQFNPVYITRTRHAETTQRYQPFYRLQGAEAAAAYFATTLEDAALCFGQQRATVQSYRRNHARDVTAREVSQRLLGLPFDLDRVLMFDRD